MMVPQFCWWLLLAAIVLSAVAADWFVTEGDERGAVACEAIMVIAVIAALVIYVLKYVPVTIDEEGLDEGFGGSIYDPEFEEHIRQTRDWARA